MLSQYVDNSIELYLDAEQPERKTLEVKGRLYSRLNTNFKSSVQAACQGLGVVQGNSEVGWPLGTSMPVIIATII